jgi:hypothetical protein
VYLWLVFYAISDVYNEIVHYKYINQTTLKITNKENCIHLISLPVVIYDWLAFKNLLVQYYKLNAITFY